MIRFEIILGRIMTMLLESWRYEVIVISEDASATVLKRGTNPPGPIDLSVLLAIRILPEEKHLLAFPRRYDDCSVCKTNKHRYIKFKTRNISPSFRFYEVDVVWIKYYLPVWSASMFSLTGWSCWCTLLAMMISSLSFKYKNAVHRLLVEQFHLTPCLDL